MTSIQSKLQALRELGEKATPGPWRATPHEAECSEIIIPAPFPCSTPEERLMLLWPVHNQEQTRAAEVLWYDTADFIAASRDALPKLVEFAEGVRERHKPEHRYNGTSAMDCGCKVAVLDADCRWPRCAGCGLTYPCPDIEVLSKLGEGL